MKMFWFILSWLFGILFILLFILSWSSGHYLPSVFVFISAILVIPDSRKWLTVIIGHNNPTWLQSFSIPILLFFFIYLILKGMGNKQSIYKTPEINQKLMAIYDKKMNQWPVPFEQCYIHTRYGIVHVIISGPENARPVLLLHASSMSSWSWLYNIKGINNACRTYAIDTIGDAGKSELSDIHKFPADGKALAGLYSEIMDSLNVAKAVFIGASQGGFIATNIALHAPDRITKLILCGPMGYTGIRNSILRILFTTMFPVKPVRQSTIRWAFGENPAVI
jgi:hypothetical protein